MKIESLECRCFFSAFGIDVTWGHNGRLQNQALIGVLGNGFITQSPSKDRSQVKFFHYDNDSKLLGSFRAPMESQYMASLDHKGRIVYVTAYDNPDAPDVRYHVYRYLPSGQLDSAFGDNGLQTIRIRLRNGEIGNYQADFLGMTFDSDDSVVLKLNVSIKRHFRTYIARLNEDGTFDRQFEGGKKYLQTTTSSGAGYGVWIDHQHRVLTSTPQRDDNAKWTITRYNPDGQIDTTFANNGELLIISDLNAPKLLLDNQSRIHLLVDRIANDDSYYTHSLRFDQSGHSDLTWNHTGDIVVERLVGGASQQFSTDGKLLILSQTARQFSQDGTPDTAFGNNGSSAVSPWFYSSSQQDEKLLQLSDGRWIENAYDIRRSSTNTVLRAFNSPVARGTSGALYIFGDETDDQVTIRQTNDILRVRMNGLSYRFQLTGLHEIDVDLGDGNNTFTSATSSLPVFLNTGNSNNTIHTGSGDDTIYSGNGDDRIDTGDGMDSIRAGHGDNAVFSGAGYDLIFTGQGNDSIYGSGGRDMIRCGDGDDFIDGGNGADHIFPGDGNDTLAGGSLQDLITKPDYTTYYN